MQEAVSIMQKCPVILCHGRYPLDSWTRVPSRFRDELRDKLQKEMEQDSSLPSLVNSSIERKICLQEIHSSPSCFSIKMTVSAKYVDEESRNNFLATDTLFKALLENFPGSEWWYIFTLIQEPIPI
jgi:hypothetical protein